MICSCRLLTVSKHLIHKLKLSHQSEEESGKEKYPQDGKRNELFKMPWYSGGWGVLLKAVSGG